MGCGCRPMMVGGSSCRPRLPRSLTVSVTVGPPAADEIRAAYAVGDLEVIAEVLGPAITDQTDWAGAAERRFEVEVITDITVT